MVLPQKSVAIQAWEQTTRITVTLERRKRQSEREKERERGIDGKERWDGRFEHPHMQWTHKFKHLGSLLASPLLLPYPPLVNPLPVLSGFTCHVFRLRQAWSGLRNLPVQVLCPAVGKLMLPLRATLSFLATSARLIHSRWMARRRGSLSSNTLAHPSHLPWEGVLRIKEKSGLRFLVENMAKSLSEVQSPVSRNSWREAHLI